MIRSNLDRRELLVALAGGAAALCCKRGARAEDESRGAALDAGPVAPLVATPARWWKSAGELRIECELCPNKCRVADRERGTCGVRENRDGKYYTLEWISSRLGATIVARLLEENPRRILGGELP